MDDLRKDTLRFLQEEFGPNDHVIGTAEEWEYFQTKPKKEILQPPKKPLADAMEEIRSLVSKAAPQMVIKKEIPDDASAKKIASHWQEELGTAHAAILSFGETGPAFEFLQNVAAAISAHFTVAKVIDGHRFEREKKWPILFDASPLKLILAAPGWKKSSLLSFYKQNPAVSLHFLSDIPFLALHPFSNYSQNPSLKRDLWKAIVSHLSS